MFRALRFQLLAVLVGFTLINFTLFIVYYLISENKRQVNDLERKITEIEVLVLKNTENINDYFTYDTKDPNYFIFRHSNNLKDYNHIYKHLQHATASLSQYKRLANIDKEQNLHYIKNVADTINIKLNQITALILQRGFKNFGLEGIMRQHAHNLEAMQGVDITEILMLRRHEKDYIIRNEEKYISAFNTRLLAYKEKIKKLPLSDKTKEAIKTELELYYDHFNRMVELDKQIGIKNNRALKKELDDLIDELSHKSLELTNNCEDFKTELFGTFKILSVITIFIVISIAIVFSFSFSKRITIRISKLSDLISNFVSSGFTSAEQLQVKEKNDEVGALIENFEIMREKIGDQLNYLEEKVAERTEEIKTQNEQIVDQNEKLINSLRYAVNIQEALMPHDNFIAKNLGEFFVFYRPKDLVSGDFYWYKTIKSKNKNLSVFAVADCTGHGIPGAFMSMLGIAFLNEIVIRKDVLTSADVLEQLRAKVLENLSLKNNGKVINDGMDIALAVIDHNKMTLQFSGAYRDLFIVRNNELRKVSGNKMPIGKYLTDEKQPFTFTEVSLEKEDMLYMFTDGFADQEGGPKGKKYLRKNLKRFLASISDKAMHEQKKAIEMEFMQWKKEYAQTDDVLVTGIRI